MQNHYSWQQLLQNHYSWQQLYSDCKTITHGNNCIQIAKPLLMATIAYRLQNHYSWQQLYTDCKTITHDNNCIQIAKPLLMATIVYRLQNHCSWQQLYTDCREQQHWNGFTCGKGIENPLSFPSFKNIVDNLFSIRINATRNKLTKILCRETI